MGLISSICKIGEKAVNYGRRALKVTPDFLLGETSEVVGKGIKNTKGSIFAKAKGGVLALEKHVAQASTKGSFFTRLWKGIASTPAAFSKNIKQGVKVAGRLGKSKTWGVFKGIGKTISKKMPIIGALLTIATEIPNIYRAFRDGGFGAGLKEIAGAGLKLGCMSTGAAIGSAICPGVGTLIGGIIGTVAGRLIRGKTFTEKQEEAKQQIAKMQDTTEEGEVGEETLVQNQDSTERQNSTQQTPKENEQTTIPSISTPSITTPSLSMPTLGTFGTGFGSLYSDSLMNNGLYSSPYLSGTSYSNPFGYNNNYLSMYTSPNYYSNPFGYMNNYSNPFINMNYTNMTTKPYKFTYTG